jgi:hypothetical protein
MHSFYPRECVQFGVADDALWTASRIEKDVPSNSAIQQERDMLDGTRRVCYFLLAGGTIPFMRKYSTI